MASLFSAVVLILGSAVSTPANTVVFWQEGFRTIASQPVPHDILSNALIGTNLRFTGIDGFRDLATLARADLVLFPYGSAVPVDVWSAIHGYLRRGGNPLILGGKPLRVPGRFADGKFMRSLERKNVDVAEHRVLGTRLIVRVSTAAGKAKPERCGRRSPR